MLLTWQTLLPATLTWIERRLREDPEAAYRLAAVVPGTTYRDGEVVGGARYCWRVRAYAGLTWSNEACAKAKKQNDFTERDEE